MTAQDRRWIARSMAATGVATVVSSALGLLLLVVVARWLGPDDNAAFLSIWGLVFGVASIVGAGDGEIARLAARAAAAGSRAPRSVVSVALLAGLLGVLATVVAVLTPWGRGLTSGSPGLLAVILLAPLAVAGQSVVRSSLLGSGDVTSYAVVVVAEAVVRLAALGLAVWLVAASLPWAVTAVVTGCFGWLAMAGRAAGVVTNPIQKSALYDAGFRHPGHTEWLAELTGAEGPPVMMLACPGLRVVPVTVHVALARAIASLSAGAIVTTARITAQALRSDFAIAAPRLAVAGLNPHAGEAGAMGDEEGRIIAPAIAALQEAGIAVAGPLPPDTMFSPRARRSYDCAICMYHDQALIPIKTIAFDDGVNVTLGLPFVRTSPDHGTAFDIAGSGRANPSSLIAALRLAARMAAAPAA